MIIYYHTHNTVIHIIIVIAKYSKNKQHIKFKVKMLTAGYGSVDT